MERRTIFPGTAFPILLVLPQLLLTTVFFLWPAGQAIWSSMTRADPFGIRTQFVGAENFHDLFTDPLYIDSIGRTVVFCVSVATISMAVAPAVAAVLWILLLHPQIGLIGRWLNRHGIAWDYKLNSTQAMAVVIGASAWKQVSYNFIFFLAGLQSIPKAVIEAARMDGAKGWFRFRTVVLPLLMPTVFFLIVVNLVYAAFDTFGTIQALTQGGPGKATETLVVKVFRDGLINLDVGGSSAQSVVLMTGVIVLTALQFRFLGKKTDE
jgi:sn-glycerol 3-phosphate transport system permease protein